VKWQDEDRDTVSEILKVIGYAKKRGIKALYVGNISKPVRRSLTRHGYFICDGFCYWTLTVGQRDEISGMRRPADRSRYIKKELSSCDQRGTG